MYSYFSFQVHGNADQHGGGLLDAVNGVLAFLETLASGGGECGLFATLFPALASISNYHPLIVHFPIAFLFSFFLLDVIGSITKKAKLRDIAAYFLYAGAIGALLTVIAGFMAAYSLPHTPEVHSLMLKHQYLGISVLLFASALAVWRYKTNELTGGAQHFFIALASVLCVLLMFTADLGGYMVYGYGAAVNPTHDGACHTQGTK